MKCRHCRASAVVSSCDDELNTDECMRVLKSLSQLKPMIIWTGGEPMMRSDLVELVRHASSLGIRSVLAPCGMLVTTERLLTLKDAGVVACSFSIDGPDSNSHDSFRGVKGAWDAVFHAMAAARAVHMPFQVNTVVRKGSIRSLDAVYEIAMAEGAMRLDLFFLVPTGRGRAIESFVPDDGEIDEVIAWAKCRKTKLTCCPQAGTCIGGRGFAFLSHTGDLQACGFVQTPCGNIREFDFDFIRLVEAANNPLGTSGNCRSVQ